MACLFTEPDGTNEIRGGGLEGENMVGALSLRNEMKLGGKPAY